MKTITALIILCIAVLFANAQTTIYHENMEVIDSMSSNTLTSNGNPAFNANTVYHHDGNQSYLGTFGVGDVAMATTDSINLTGNTFIVLKFWHICKIEFFDKAIVQVSNDGGVTWTDLTCAQYQGTSTNFCTQGNKFIESSYTVWQPGSGTLPDSTWWKEETFDVSSLLSNSPNAKIRFKLSDMNNNGISGRYGWLIDNIRLIAAPCELTPPSINLVPPVYQGIVYDNGPYTYSLAATDNSGIGNVTLTVAVNGGAPVNYSMTNPGGDSIYTVTPADTFAIGDTICYSYNASDATNCANSTSSQTFCFVVSQGGVLPYCDNFDNLNTWTDSLITGSPWQLGVPNYGSTSSAHSSPFAWDVSLNTAYLPNTQSFIVSPGFDFSNIGNATLKVWMNYYTESIDDGSRIDYTTNGGTTWTTLGIFNDLNGSNWYNTTNLSSTGKPGWSGFSSGWKEATRKLIEPAFNLNILPVQFRIFFKSDASFQNSGFSIDDFCLVIPAYHEIGVSNVVFNSAYYGVGTIATPKVVVTNYGANAASNFSVNYKYNGATGVPVIYSGSLAPGAKDTIYFPGITIAQGTHVYCGYVSLAADTNQLNDTLCATLTGVQSLNITYCNDFETNPGEWAAVSLNGTANWESGTPNYGSTNSTHSGFIAWDINLNTGYSGSNESHLYSPYFDLTNACNARIEFWQNRNTTLNYDGARIDIAQNGSAWNTLGIYNDPLGTNWYNKSNLYSSGKAGWDGSSQGWIKSTHSLIAYNGMPIIQLRFVFNSSWAAGSDGISIDDFCIINPPIVDIGLDTITEPLNNNPTGITKAVKVRIKNFGCTPVTNFNVYYSVNGGPAVGPTNYSGAAITSNNTIILKLDSMTIPLGYYTLCAWLSYPADSNLINDTLCSTLKGLGVDSLNYWNNFDGASATDFIPVTIAPGTSWELGTPNYGFTTGAHSGSSAWDINLNSSYAANANCELLTPFFDFTTAVNTVLYFYQKRNTEKLRDGMRLEYSLNNGAWTVLGIINDPDARHWYKHTNSYTGKPQWDGHSSGWKKSKYFLHNFDSSGVMRFKFVFTSNYQYNHDGISIDDFAILKAPDYNLGLTNLSNPGVNGGYVIGTAYTPTVTLKNVGGFAVDSIPIVLTINGNYITTQYYYPTLLTYQSVLVTFAGVNYIIPQGTTTVCAYVDYPLEFRHHNDTLRTDLVGVPTMIPAYTNNFDSINDGWTAYSPDTITRWQLGTPNYGATNSAHSPPSCWDINLNSGYRKNANCALYSPWFDFTNVVNARLSFWINYKTDQGNDGARLDYTVNGGASYTTLGSYLGAGSSNWYNDTYINSSAKPAWTGNSGGWQLAKDSALAFLDTVTNPIRFKFVFNSDASKLKNDGVSIDDFSLYYPLVLNAAANSISGNTVAAPGNQYFGLTYSNSGSIYVNDVITSLKVDGTLIVSDTINPIPGGPLSFGQTATHSFGVPVGLAPGAHLVCSYTSFPNGANDMNHADDTICKNIFVLDSTSVFPYCNNFDSGTAWQTLNNTNNLSSPSWQLGTPTKAFISSAHTAPNAWVTKLTTFYPNNDNSSLYSIAFNVDSGNCYELSFWHIFKTELNIDGGEVEYSVDGGLTWLILGDTGEMVNWYNTANISAFGAPHFPGWTGTSTGWIHTSHIWTCNQTGDVVFRWRFRSSASYFTEGWSVDDVCFVKIAAPCFMQVNELNQTGFYLYQNIPNPSSGATEIPFYIPHSGKVTLEISNVLGQIVNVTIDEILNEGKHAAIINSGILSAGVYNYTLKFEEKQLMRRMIITK